MDDAKTAKLWMKESYTGKDTPWITSPKRMLAMRARGFGLRDKFADALRGMILAEEAMDIPPDMRPTRETGKLDVQAQLGTLAPSAEPNRGHGDNIGIKVVNSAALAIRQVSDSLIPDALRLIFSDKVQARCSPVHHRYSSASRNPMPRWHLWSFDTPASPL